MAEAELERKRREIKRSEERIEYHTRMMTEAPRLRRIYEYWLHYHRVRVGDWTTRLWFEELRDVVKKRVIKAVEEGALTPDFQQEIRKTTGEYEGRIEQLLSDIRETRRIATERNWRLAWPREYPTMVSWMSAIYGRLGPIRQWITEILRELIILEIIHSKIVIYAITESERPGKPYHKRFQGFFNVDALRNISTGDIDYTYELTKKELDACTWEFYFRWNWVKEGEAFIPKYTSTPEWADAGEWEPIEKPLGATIKEISVIEEGEETYFDKFEPPQLIYTVIDEEIRAMLRHIGKTEAEIEKILRGE